MNRFLTDTLTDIRRGRQTWRVFVAFCAPAFVVALLSATFQRLG